MLCNDGQYLEIYTVKLIEAGPGAATSESLEELSHRQVVQAIGAIEDNALLGNGLGKVFDRP